MAVRVPSAVESLKMEPPAKGRLFVYGSLRAGNAAHSIIADRVRSSERATVAGSLFGFEAGYPGLVDGALGRVVGELLEIHQLSAALPLLDAYEGQQFARVQRKVRRESGQEVWAWCYILASADLAARGVPIEHGDWVRYRRSTF